MMDLQNYQRKFDAEHRELGNQLARLSGFTNDGGLAAMARSISMCRTPVPGKKRVISEWMYAYGAVIIIGLFAYARYHFTF